MQKRQIYLGDPISLNRRNFLKSGLGLASAASLASTPVFSWMTQTVSASGKLAPLSVASGDSPADNVQLGAIGVRDVAAIAALRGLQQDPDAATRSAAETALSTLDPSTSRGNR